MIKALRIMLEIKDSQGGAHRTQTTGNQYNDDVPLNIAGQDGRERVVLFLMYLGLLTSVRIRRGICRSTMVITENSQGESPAR